ncbi:MAG TPA: DUF4180 domain-containing protein [Candidatus Saccharimonadales bacterium]|nr:DUF4180 domain-containing protein [Candidatus Saccharimonadales bacterium]
MKESPMESERRFVIASNAGISIGSSGDIADAIGACLGTAGLLLTANDLAPEFFDLRTGLAGELFQKFTNYRVRVAIVLPDPGAYGERFTELAHEHRRHELIRLVGTQSEATAWLGAERRGDSPS